MHKKHPEKAVEEQRKNIDESYTPASNLLEGIGFSKLRQGSRHCRHTSYSTSLSSVYMIALRLMRGFSIICLASSRNFRYWLLSS